MSDKKGLVAEFREFIAAGNMIELAVGVILAGAVGVVIRAFTDGIMLQIVAAVFGQPNFDDITITLRENVGKADENGDKADAVLQIGTFVNALITLVLTGLVLFAIVKAYNRLKQRKKVEDAIDEAVAGPTELQLLTEIRDSLRARS
jgi:large conductance mechanosensitive channel